MDKLKADVRTVESCSLVNQFSTRQGLELSVSLPEYFGDIVKVLRCSVTPVAVSVVCQSGQITAEGYHVVRMVYVAENGGVYAYETSEQFSRHLDVSDCDGCNVVDFIWAEGCSCRAVSPRRFDVRAVVQFHFKCYGTVSRELLDTAEGGGIQLQEATIQMENVKNVLAKKITLNETNELPAGKPDANRILSVSASAALTETKAISGKLMLKGEVTQKILYISEGSGTPETAKLTLPFSEIADVNGLTDAMEHRVQLRLVHSDVVMKPLQSGSMRIAESTVHLQAEIFCGSEAACRIVSDAFSTDYDVKTASVAVESVLVSRQIAENVMTTGDFSLAELAPESILDHECRVESMKTIVQGDTALVQGSVVFGLLYQSNAGGLGYVERNLDFTWSKELSGIAGELRLEPYVSVFASSVSLNGQQAAVQAELFVEGKLTAVQPLTAISQVELLEDHAKARDETGMIIYFAEQGENVWDIAKRYNTSPALLAADNRLSGDTIAEKQTLLISCV